jgi:pyridoxal phosphate enzyme (YggS family)
MNSIVQRLEKIKSQINNNDIKIIAVSKTFAYDHIKPLVDYGHNHFGENKVQEAHSKWHDIKKKKPEINLHMIGKLQSNKAKEAVNLFDYIHSLDTQKLAILLAKHENNANKKLKYFIQVNVGKEKQKTGIGIELLDDFYYYCTKELHINVIGLMAIPPNDGNENIHFKHLMELNKSLGLKELSMGMSGDFQKALEYKATFVRIGSSIFGNRA